MGSIWDAAIEELKKSKENEKPSNKFLFFTGGSSSGKTTSILNFLSRDEKPRPTVALEYTFARKSGNLQNKITSHIWELGGGSHLNKLLQIPINPQTIQHLTIVIVVDLSKPEMIWKYTEELIKNMKVRAEDVIKEVNKEDPNFGKALKKAAKHRLGSEKDKFLLDSIKPFPIPLIIIGSKYDLFEDFDLADKKLITGAMRCIALYNAASLLFVSSKIESTNKNLRHILNAAAFDVKLNKTSIIEENRPIYIPVGSDNLKDIGVPPKTSNSLPSSNKISIDSWKAAFCERFKQSDNKQEFQEDPIHEKQFAEPKIDEIRAQKDQILEAYKKEENRKWTSKIN